MNTIVGFEAMLANLVSPESTICIPEDLDNYKKEDYPHWTVFVNLHLGVPLSIADIEHNSKIIGEVPEDLIKQISMSGLEARGLRYVEQEYID